MQKIKHFFYSNFHNNENINHCTEEHKVFIIYLTNIIMDKYDTNDLIENRTSPSETVYFPRFPGDFAVQNIREMYFCDVCTAVLFAFYMLILLELSGDVLSIEEICYFMRIQNSAIPKIQEIYYGIIWGDNPVLAEIRGRILFPYRYIR